MGYPYRMVKKFSVYHFSVVIFSILIWMGFYKVFGELYKIVLLDRYNEASYQYSFMILFGWAFIHLS